MEGEVCVKVLDREIVLNFENLNIIEKLIYFRVWVWYFKLSDFFKVMLLILEGRLNVRVFGIWFIVGLYKFLI